MLADYKEFLAKFLKPIPEELLTDIVTHGKRVFHDPQHNQAWCDENNLKPHSVGLFLGETKKGFQPTPYCLERISQHTDSEVVVDAKGAWLFLCGRDIFGKAIKSGEPGLNKPVFLYDEAHNLLGYGTWAVEKLKPNKVVINHQADKGVYLRRR